MLLTLDISGETFRVHDEGRGRPVLLVHGFPFNLRMWTPVSVALAPARRVIAPDLRGFGGSTVTEGTVSMERMADDLAAVLDELDVTEPVVYVGFSMGGYVGWSFLERHRDKVAALVACDTKASADPPDGEQARRELAERVLAEGSALAADVMLPKLLAPGRAERDPELAANVRALMLKADPRGIAAALRGMAERPDVRDRLPGLDLPALVIGGEHDVLSPPDEMRAMAQALPRGRYVEVPGAGHLAPLEAPEAVIAAVSAFLDELG